MKGVTMECHSGLTIHFDGFVANADQHGFDRNELRMFSDWWRIAFEVEGEEVTVDEWKRRIESYRMLLALFRASSANNPCPSSELHLWEAGTGPIPGFIRQYILDDLSETSIGSITDVSEFVATIMNEANASELHAFEHSMVTEQRTAPDEFPVCRCFGSWQTDLEQWRTLKELARKYPHVLNEDRRQEISIEEFVEIAIREQLGEADEIRSFAAMTLAGCQAGDPSFRDRYPVLTWIGELEACRTLKVIYSAIKRAYPMIDSDSELQREAPSDGVVIEQ